MTTAEERIKAARKAHQRYASAIDFNVSYDAFIKYDRCLLDAAGDLFAAVDERDALRARIAKLEQKLLKLSQANVGEW